MKLKGHLSLPDNVALGYPYFHEIRGTDGRLEIEGPKL